jgi:hypothetical protein
VKIKALLFVFLIFVSLLSPVRVSLPAGMGGGESSLLSLDLCHAGPSFAPASMDSPVVPETVYERIFLPESFFTIKEKSSVYLFLFSSEEERPPRV